MHRATASILAVLVLLLPGRAWACPVCGQGAPGSEGAYLLMSGILSALPLLMAGGIVVWVIVRARAAVRESSTGEGHQPIERQDPARGDDVSAAGTRSQVHSVKRASV